MVDNTTCDNRRVCLAAVLWMAIAGAASVNQRVLLQHVSGETAGALSALLWVVEALCVAVLIYLLDDATSREKRLSATLVAWFPLMLPLWFAVIGVYYLKILPENRIPSILMLAVVPLLMWCTRPSALVYLVALLTAIMGFGALLWPWTGLWGIIASCACLVGAAAAAGKPVEVNRDE